MLSRARVHWLWPKMPSAGRWGQALILPSVVAAVVVGFPGGARADGIFEAFTGSVESNYSFFTNKTTDASGHTTKTEVNAYTNRFTLNVNYNLFPNLNLNAGGTFEDAIADPVNDTAIRKTEARRGSSYAFLTLRDPVYTASLGYDMRENILRTSGQAGTTLSQENFIASLDWRPEGFPWTKFAYTRTNTQDGDRSVLDTEKDYAFLKSEYRYKGLDAYYAGTYINTLDNVRNFETQEFSNEGRVAFSTTLFNGRTSITTDNRLNVTTIDTTTSGQGQIGFPVFPITGLFALDDTPVDGALGANPALIDGNLTASAGVNIGRPALGGDTRQRNVGLDFVAAQDVNSLLVWVDRDLPFEIASSYSWDVYTSTDNLNWTFSRTIPSAPFGPFLTRFEITFPTVKTRYIKVVTRPLSPAVIIPPGFANPDQIFITEIQALLNKPAQDVKGRTTRTFQNYMLDVKQRLLDIPSLYYGFNGYYMELSPNGQQQYNISNGLFFNHSFNPILSGSGNVAVEFGAQGNDQRVALLYYASLLANPLKTLSSNLVFSGNNQTVGDLTSRSNSVILYNTAQLYKGIDANLNLGFVLTSDEQYGGGTVDRRSAYVNVGTTVTPHPTMALTLYYLGKLTHASGNPIGLADITENRVDLSASWTPIRSIFLSASVNVASETGQQNRVQQSYGVNWTPFPDGQLQFSFYYNDSYYPDRSRLIQPTLRWYLTQRRRSYLDVSYTNSDAEAAGLRTETSIISSTLKIFF